MERRARSCRETWGHSSAVRGCGFGRPLTQFTIGCGSAESTQRFRICRAVASHDRTDIGRISRTNGSKDALDLRARISLGGGPGCQRSAHDDPHLIPIGWHHPVSGSRKAREIGACEVLLADRRPTSTVDRRHPHLTTQIDSSIRTSARLGGIDVAGHPAARCAGWNRVTSGRLS